MKITLESLVKESLELDLSRNPETGNVAVVCGDGLNYGMYIFNKEGDVINSNECGFESALPYCSANEYLFAYEHGDKLENPLTSVFN